MPRYRLETQPDYQKEPDPAHTTEYDLNSEQVEGILAVVNAINPNEPTIRIQMYIPPTRVLQQARWYDVTMDDLFRSSEYLSQTNETGDLYQAAQKQAASTYVPLGRYVFAVKNQIISKPFGGAYTLLTSESPDLLQGITNALGWYGLNPSDVVKVYDQGQEMQIGG